MDGPHLLGAAFGESQHVNGEENIFLAAVVAELDGFPLIGEKREVRSHVTDLQRHARDSRFVHLMRERRNRRRND